MTLRDTSSPMTLPDAPELLAAAASAAGVDPKLFAAASEFVSIARQLQGGDSAAVIAKMGNAVLAHARPEIAQALALAQQMPDISAVTQGCFGGSHVADHPLTGQAPQEFCTPIPVFMPRTVNTARTPDTPTGTFTDAGRLLRFYSPLVGEQALLIDTFNGTTAISSPFSLRLQLLSLDASIPLKALLGKNVSVGIALADGSEAFMNGYVDKFSFERTDGGYAFYKAHVVPWFSFLGKRVNARIFQDLTVLGIVESIFADYKQVATYVFRTSQSYEPEKYIVQYNETDAHFVSRLLESHGLFYYFEHSPNGHTMVISDDSCHRGFCPPHVSHAAVKYNDGSRAQHEDTVTSLGACRELHASRVTINTFDFKSPFGQRIIEGDTVAEQGDVPFIEHYDGAPAFAYRNRAHGERETRRRLEEMEWQGKLFHGTSDCRGFNAGHTFELLEHYWFDNPRDGDNDFLLLEVHYEGHNNFVAHGTEPVYRNSFTALRRKIPYRPRVVHKAPRMAGPQTAIVVGPKGAETHTDQYGRIKVQFPWDRSGTHDERSSCWIRVSQPLAGNGYGLISIPRVGQEVLIDFLDGRADRPVVIGRLFNGAQATPYGLPAAANVIGLRTRSTPGGGGFNEVALHDPKGKELVNIHAQRDMVTTVRNSQSTLVYGPVQATVVKNGAQQTCVHKSIETKSETGHIQLTAETEIVFEVGVARIRMKADGTIEIWGNLIVFPLQGPKKAAPETPPVAAEASGADNVSYDPMTGMPIGGSVELGNSEVTPDPFGAVIVRTSVAAYRNPAQAGVGVVKAILNAGPSMANLAVSGVKWSADVHAKLLNKAGLVSDNAYEALRNSKPASLHIWTPSNDAQSFGMVAGDVGMALGGTGGVAKQVGKGAASAKAGQLPGNGSRDAVTGGPNSLAAAENRLLNKFQKTDGVPNTGHPVLDALAINSTSFPQKLNAMRRAGYQVIENPALVARGEFSPGKIFEYNPHTMTRLDLAHEWRHFKQFQQMEAMGLKLNSNSFGIARGPGELGAYKYEAKLWNRAGISPTSEYMSFHNSQLTKFDDLMGNFRREAAGKYGNKWRGIDW